MKYVVKQQMTLMEFLLLHYARKQVKIYFKYKQVFVNQSNITQFDYVLQSGDAVEISKESKQTNTLDIIHEDDVCIVINKPSGLLSMSDGKEKQKTAYHLVREYLQQKDRQAKVFIVHRLDRETSGVLLFAKNETYKKLLQEQWNNIVYKRGYMAIVEGNLQRKSGVIRNYLEENKTHHVYVTKKGGKLSITNYTVIKETKNYSLIEVFLDTGRKNQIRVHMQSLGHSIVGDKKYGASTNPIRRLGLHAHVFGFEDPITKKHFEFEASLPTVFQSLFR